MQLPSWLLRDKLLPGRETQSLLFHDFLQHNHGSVQSHKGEYVTGISDQVKFSHIILLFYAYLPRGVSFSPIGLITDGYRDGCLGETTICAHRYCFERLELIPVNFEIWWAFGNRHDARMANHHGDFIRLYLSMK